MATPLKFFTVSQGGSDKPGPTPHHGAGHEVCPAAAGVGCQAFSASGMQRGDRSPGLQPVSALAVSLQTLRSFA
jgi:hypothetical protein